VVIPDWVYDERDRSFMAAALEQARAAAAADEVPVGCVVVREGAILARAGNRREASHDPTAHAELLALRAAAASAVDWRLPGATMYVTLEPCPMCTAACRQARLELVIWGAADPLLGACGTAVDLAADPRLGPPLANRGGLLAEESRELLRSFFARSRASS
jgi:tRNA(adenine34) deaminase